MLYRIVVSDADFLGDNFYLFLFDVLHFFLNDWHFFNLCLCLVFNFLPLERKIGHIRHVTRFPLNGLVEPGDSLLIFDDFASCGFVSFLVCGISLVEVVLVGAVLLYFGDEFRVVVNVLEEFDGFEVGVHNNK